MPDHHKIMAVIKPLMIEASRIAMQHYCNLESVEYKSDNSPLTAADLEIDRLIHDRLKAEFPEIAIITEEQAQTHKSLPKDQPFFLVDPIDGTKEFINKRDEFTVNIGLIENGKPVLGAVAVPAKSTLYLGSNGDGATLYHYNMESGDLGPASNLGPGEPDNDGLKVVASRSHLCENTQKFIDANNVKTLVNAGSSLKFCLLACGDADLYPRFGPTMEWDTAAGHAVLAAVGGQVDDQHGKPLEYGKSDLRNGVFIAYVPGVIFHQS